MVSGIHEAVRTLAREAVTDAQRVEALRELEELKNIAAAAQARLADALDASQRAEQAAAGVPAARQGRGVAAQVALARRESPHRGARHLGLAKTLLREMPHTFAALEDGRLTEWQTTLLAQESAVLTAEHRALVDETLCADPTRLDGLGDRGIAGAARTLAQRLDAAAAVRRASRAATDRRVTFRAMPDTMALVSALLPVAQGVAVHAALKTAADTARSGGDPRSRGQVMADTLVERTTGQTRAEAVPVGVLLLTPTDTILPTSGASSRVHEPVHLQGYGTIPAGYARDILRTALTEADTATRSWFKRLFTTPTTGQVVALDSHARHFPTGLGALIGARDAGICRTPWCEGPIRHLDHVIGVDDGGPTTETNGQGLCEACNHTKQAPGWHATPVPGIRHTVQTITPTGHTYTSTAPAPPGTSPPPPRSRPAADLGWLERVLAEFLDQLVTS